MHANKWHLIPALIAGASILGGCQTIRAPGEPAQPIIAPSIVTPTEKCPTDQGRPDRDFMANIYVGAPGTKLVKDGSKLIAPGEIPRFRVERSAKTPPGKVHIKFIAQVNESGQALIETPFVKGNRKVFEFIVLETDENGRPQPGKPWFASFRARSMCDGVCTFENPCKYSIYYVPDDPDKSYPELDPYTIIH